MFEKREKLVLAIFLIIFVGILFSFFANFGNKNNSTEDKSNFVIVHVTGEVKNPGVYRLEEGARVVDAVNLAGGPLPSADLDRINLADFLKDGSKIYIPPKDDNLDSNSKNQNALKDGLEKKGKVNINTASKEELESLPGIGPTLAQRIIEYREENGVFTSAEDLLNVKGIGEKKLEKIKDQITW
ncbi:ComEA family DNA-binding protein [Dictyoglomus thermophilum]|uniref:helix-hairpin-helix domain-containing protein n=1 Tax=Dictyoglomus thermophilum TaxID=14 RepID=UPI0011EABD4D|nr:helix-hairpin-helix domain-containing protein [Dictyoglomus thermophilum]TYT22436.1 ComEA family DNA-binding protein [Dictyoglomus thermophilum]